MKHTDEHKAKARLESEDACLNASGLVEVREALTKCRDKFREYEQIHRLKNSAEGTAKAKRNSEMADMCDLALQSMEKNADSPSEAVDAERRRIIRRAHEAGDFVTGEDGFFVYWPTPLQGSLNEWALGVIAEELRRLNAPWVAKMSEYFASADTRPQGGDATEITEND